MLQCWRRTKHCPLFSSPSGEFDSSRVPTLGNLPFAIQGKQNANARGSTREGGGGGVGSKWNWLMHNPALNNPAQGNRNRSVCCWFLGNRLHWKVKKKNNGYSPFVDESNVFLFDGYSASVRSHPHKSADKKSMRFQKNKRPDLCGHLGSWEKFLEIYNDLINVTEFGYS